MRVDLLSIHGLGPGANPGSLAEWRVGAILAAIAVRDAKSGQLWLDIGGQRHPARLASSDGDGPAHGERLQLRVLRNSPVLALETVSTTKPTDARGDAAILPDALRRFVPRQQSPAPLLANLSWLAAGKNGTDGLPKAVTQAAAQLWQALPHVEDLFDPASLESALRRSGTFLEANLANHHGRPSATIASDLKALMLSLRQSLTAHDAKPAAAASSDAVAHATPPGRGPLTTLPAMPASLSIIDATPQQLNELARQTEGALARLTTAQIANNSVDPSVQSVLIELPVRHDDRAAVLRLQIERDDSRRHSSSGAETWTVEAAVDLGGIGALHAKVTLTGKRIGVQFRAESPSVVDALASRAGQLESMLRSAGLEIDRVLCLHGVPAAEITTRSRLLDVRA
jgi:hypothetical protein